MKLWLVRHPAPEVAPGICYGRLDMAALADATSACAAALLPLLPERLAIASSPLRRCQQLAQALERPFATDARLQEMDFGAWEGRPWQDLPRAELDAWTADFARHKPGGGENVHGFMARVASAFDELAGADTLWVTHAGVIRAVQLLAGGVRELQDARQWPTAAPGYGQWCTLDLANR